MASTQVIFGYSCICILFVLGLGCIIQLFFVPGAIEDAFYATINDRIVMTQAQQDDNTEDYQNWVNNNKSDAPLQFFEYWIYNITNPYDVPNGDYPIFQLLGPFTFRRFERRSAPDDPDEEPRFHQEDDETTVEYDYLYTFEFQPDRSGNTSLDEMVWVISGAMQGFFRNINAISGSGPFLLPCVDEALAEYPGHSIFYHTPIRNLTVGIEDQWILRLDDYCGDEGLWEVIKPNTLYSLIADGTSRVIQHTGEANITKVAELEQFRNWSTPETNSWKLGGGDLWMHHNETVSGARETRNFPPKSWLNKDRELNIWSLEKFRSTKYLYQRDVVYKGVDLMRFRLDDNEGKACEYEYDENGTIIDESANCKYYQFWEDGVWNLTNLRGSPSFLSKGRFLDAPYFLNTTNKAFGISMPTPEEDDQFFDVDPLSGIVMRNFHNYQINFEFIDMRRPYATNFTNFTVYDRLIPMAYVRVEALGTDKQMDFYASALKAIDVINGFSLYGGPALAVICFGLMFFILCKMKRQSGYTDGQYSGQYGRLVEDNSQTHTDIAMGNTKGGVATYGSTKAPN